LAVEDAAAGPAQPPSAQLEQSDAIWSVVLIPPIVRYEFAKKSIYANRPVAAAVQAFAAAAAVGRLSLRGNGSLADAQPWVRWLPYSLITFVLSG
jgi:hypothetical protein